MIKEVVIHVHMEYYSAIKSNAFESVLMRCMDLELIVQSEVKSSWTTAYQAPPSMGFSRQVHTDTEIKHHTRANKFKGKT